jgi:hypothetical protein
MDQPNNHPNPPGDSAALILSFSDANALANLPPEVEIATMRQMMQSLFARVDALQQNQAIQLAGVHDRLDAVELEIPMIQEQSALRIRDLETRVNLGIEDATATLQSEVAGRFTSLAAQMEAQRGELSELRESKKLADTRLNRVIADIERLCGNLEVPAAPRPDATPAPVLHSRIAEHIRRAALDLGPREDNPLVADISLKKVRAHEPLVPNGSVAPPVQAARPATVNNQVPGFEAWKRQFMQDGEPDSPSLSAGPANQHVICPRCFSDRTRPATLGRLDRIFHIAGFTPHRCKSCAHRFYKRDAAAGTPLDDGQPPPRTPDAMETQ